MNIAIFVNDFPLVSETFILNQIVGLLQRGHDVSIYTRFGSSRTVDPQHADVERYKLLNRIKYQVPVLGELARLRSTTSRTIRWGWRDLEAVADALNVFRYRRPALNLILLHELLPPENHRSISYDVIHCHFGPNGKRAIAWRNFGALRGPIITSFHGYDVNKLPRIYGANIYKNLFSQGNMFTVGSEFLRGRIVALGAPDDRIAMLAMGVDLSRFPFSERTKSTDGEFRLLTVARLVEVKGIEYALLAVASLKDKCPGIRYQIIGAGPLRSELEALTNHLGIADKVEFLGALPHEEIVLKLSSAHVFVLPSIVTASGEEENQSVALAEAQASGLPVIATAIGGNFESIHDGESGFLVAPRNLEALATSIFWLADHPDVWGQMGRAGRAHVEAHFNLEKLNDRLIEIYCSVAPCRERGQPKLGSRMLRECPLVTVIVPVYNGQRWIDRTLASAVAQTYQNIEIVVVDDGSEDETPAIVEAAASRDQRIRLFRKSHSGLPATRNFGIKHARGTLIAPLDADDLWHPEKLSRQVAAIEASSPKVGLVYCWAVEIDEDDLIVPPIRNGSTAQGSVRAELVAKAGIIDSASNPLIRRSYLDAVSGYDPHQTLGAEDWKLYLTLSEICEFAVVPKHLVGYRRLTGSMSRKVAKMDQAMELVAHWIIDRWPDMPPTIERQMNYSRNTYLAHLALTINDFANALRYQMRSYKAQPSALVMPSSFTFCMRLLARVFRLGRSNWPLGKKSIRFTDLEFNP